MSKCKYVLDDGIKKGPCGNYAIVGCDYCSNHSCNNLVCENDRNCPIHNKEECAFSYGCKLSSVKNGNFCMEHKCRFSGCHLMKTTKADYCYSPQILSAWCTFHKCAYVGCYNVAFKRGSNCDLHLCRVDGCKGVREHLKLYCYQHACVACDKLAIDGAIYCATHKCQYCDGYTICNIHTCCMCYKNNAECICNAKHRCSVCNSPCFDSTLCTYHKCMFPGCDSVAVSEKVSLCQLHKCLDCNSPYKCEDHYANNLEKIVRTIRAPKDIQNIILEYVFRDKFPFEKVKEKKSVIGGYTIAIGGSSRIGGLVTILQ